MWQYYREAPPIARALATITFTLSLLVYAGVLPYYPFGFVPKAFVQLPPELWRLFTPFFLTGGGLGILFDTYFLYTYGAKLEVASPRFSQRADFFTYILFICFAILGQNVFLGGNIFAAPLALAFITTSTIDSWDLPISFFGFVTLPAQFLPYVFLLITLVSRGPLATLVHGSGLIAAHLFDLLTGRYSAHGGPSTNLLPTPESLRKLFGTRADVARPYGTVLNANAPSGPVSGGLGSSAWGVGWGKWGRGQRLGGDAEANGSVQGERRNAVTVSVVIVFVVVSCGLGVAFMMYRDPEGWWKTLKEAILGGDLSSTTTVKSDTKSSTP